MVVIGRVAEAFPNADGTVGVVIGGQPIVSLPWFLSVNVEPIDRASFRVDATANWIRRTEGELTLLNLAGTSVEAVPVGSLVYFVAAREDPDTSSGGGGA